MQSKSADAGASACEEGMWRRKRVFGPVRDAIGREVSRTSRYCDEVIQCFPLPHDRGDLLAKVDCRKKTRIADLEQLPKSTPRSRRLFLVHGTLNHDFDVQAKLQKLQKRMRRGDRVAVVLYNPYLRWLYHAASRVGLREGPQPTTFVTEASFKNLTELSGLEVVRSRSVGFIPCSRLRTFNGILGATPVLRESSLARVMLLRPLTTQSRKLSLSIVIPARNEKGNIENALVQLRSLNEEVKLEVIFVEGHSTDDTWKEIQRVVRKYNKEFALQVYRQSGRGKSDAVRLGFSHAKHDLLTILDADLTMPPNMLKRFFDAYVEGHGDFVNGSRLVYPMEGEAMRFLNHLGNVFFAKALSAVLDNRLSDSLCGTKLISRRDYERVVEWRKDFGDFDPFGDFELLFAASILGLRTVDVPIRYMARTYGSTNISRFRHGLELLRMTLIGAAKVRMGSG